MGSGGSGVGGPGGIGGGVGPGAGGQEGLNMYGGPGRSLGENSGAYGNRYGGTPSAGYPVLQPGAQRPAYVIVGKNLVNPIDGRVVGTVQGPAGSVSGAYARSQRES